MANKRIPDLPAVVLPLTEGEVCVIDDGVTTSKADLRYCGLANTTFTYHSDSTMATRTKAGKTYRQAKALAGRIKTYLQKGHK